MSVQETWLTGFIGLSSAKKLAVDIGANCGDWTRLLSTAGFERVIAVEPDSRASSHIKEGDGIEIVHAAASSLESESAGEVTLFLRPSPDQNSLLESHPIGGAGGSECPHTGTVSVPCVSLKTLCPAGADFVKIDVEGAEERVISSCQDDGTWDRCVFLVECHDTLSAVVSQLNRLRKKVTVVEHPFKGHAHPGHCWAVGEPSA